MVPVKGKKYHVRYPTGQTLATVEVLDVTAKTVLILDEDDASFGRSFAKRYELRQVEFVEEAK